VPTGAEARLRAALADLGMPGRLLHEITGGDSYLGIVRALRTLDPAPPAPTGDGEVLAILGDLAAATAVANQVAAELDLPATRILVAAASTAGTGVPASRRLSGVDTAVRRVAKLRDEGGPLVVVVEAPGDGTADQHVHALVDAVEPAVVWAVADATRKTADTARHLAGLGRVDGLAVRGANRTADPATVLALDVPVALLDGRPATPRHWAALLCDRLVEAQP
jgi:hypothetical protein